MKVKDIIWLALLILAVLFTVSFKHVPYLPGDVNITRAIQTILPESKVWAKLVSSTAKMPWVLILIAATFAIAWLVAGWRAALMSIASFAGLWLIGKWLGPVIAQPRPSPELVRVAESASGSAFPSIFALNYAATVGFLAVIAVVSAAGALRWALLFICSLLLAIGLFARVALAAHWPSDVLVSYLIGFLWVTLLVRFIRWKRCEI